MRKLFVDSGDFGVVAQALLVPDRSSGRLTLTEYGEYVAGRVRELAATPSELTQRWAGAPTRQDLVEQLLMADINIAALADGTAAELDPLDVLISLAWNVPAPTRSERARGARERHHGDLARLSETARAVLSGLLDRYAAHGLDDITSPEVLGLAPLNALGSPVEIAKAFGGAAAFHHQVDQLQHWLYSA